MGERLVVLIRIRVFSCFSYVGPLKSIPSPSGFVVLWWEGGEKSLVKACFASRFRYLAQMWVLYLRRLIVIYCDTAY